MVSDLAGAGTAVGRRVGAASGSARSDGTVDGSGRCGPSGGGRGALCASVGVVPPVDATVSLEGDAATKRVPVAVGGNAAGGDESGNRS